MSTITIASPNPRLTAVGSLVRCDLSTLIAEEITIEGKIEGSGHVRIAGRFKGDVHVQGDLSIEPGATLTGGVRANTVIIGGQIDGNIPVLHSRAIHERAPQTVVWEVPGADHCGAISVAPHEFESRVIGWYSDASKSLTTEDTKVH